MTAPAFSELRSPGFSRALSFATIREESGDNGRCYLWASLEPRQVCQVADRRKVRVRQDGYGSRLPTDKAAFINGRWRRIWCICWPNSGSYYVDLTQDERKQWPEHKICILRGVV